MGVSGLNHQPYLKSPQCAQNCVVIKLTNPHVGCTTCQALRYKYYEYIHFTDEDLGSREAPRVPRSRSQQAAYGGKGIL